MAVLLNELFYFRTVHQFDFKQIYDKCFCVLQGPEEYPLTINQVEGEVEGEGDM